MLSLIAATGLRIGELLALRWRALNLQHGTLAVRESVFEGKFQLPRRSRPSGRFRSDPTPSLRSRRISNV